MHVRDPTWLVHRQRASGSLPICLHILHERSLIASLSVPDLLQQAVPQSMALPHLPTELIEHITSYPVVHSVSPAHLSANKPHMYSKTASSTNTLYNGLKKPSLDYRR